jgi:hypothetical protein
MSDDKQRKSKLDSIFGMAGGARDTKGFEFEMRERGAEASARDQFYVQQAFATLSHSRQVVWYGARAGFYAGSWFIAVVAMVMVVVVAAALSVDEGNFATLYGQTPLVGTIFEPLWPLLVLLPTILFFSIVGAVAAMLMRIENIQRHSLNHYFEPVRTLSDLLTFWLLTGALVFWAIQALGLTGPETDTIGLFVLTGAIGGIIAWPLHGLWLRRYLLLIREYGSASIDEILADIRRQAGD